MVVVLVLLDFLWRRECIVALGTLMLEVVAAPHVLPPRALRAEAAVAGIALESRA